MFYLLVSKKKIILSLYKNYTARDGKNARVILQVVVGLSVKFNSSCLQQNVLSCKLGDYVKRDNIPVLHFFHRLNILETYFAVFFSENKLLYRQNELWLRIWTKISFGAEKQFVKTRKDFFTCGCVFNSWILAFINKV